MCRKKRKWFIFTVCLCVRNRSGLISATMTASERFLSSSAHHCFVYTYLQIECILRIISNINCEYLKWINWIIVTYGNVWMQLKWESCAISSFSSFIDTSWKQDNLYTFCYRNDRVVARLSHNTQQRRDEKRKEKNKLKYTNI